MNRLWSGFGTHRTNLWQIDDFALLSFDIIKYVSIWTCRNCLSASPTNFIGKYGITVNISDFNSFIPL
ncbi:unnamed protein product [Rotaria sp. Silwood1]|nr:unnamed protein product [Rotaria sp. Silwood1]